MKNSIFKGKATRTKIFTLISVGVIVLTLALNYLLTYLFTSSALYADLTPEELYTLSDEMKKECAFIDTLEGEDREIKIIFCDDPDRLTSNTVTRAVYFMALDMEREFDNVKVEEINSVYNPTALAAYRTTSLTAIETTDVIIAYRNTYRIVTAESFWTKSSEGSYFSFDGEYRLATLIKSVTAIDKPVAYFTTGHGESYYDVENAENPTNAAASGIYDLLVQRGLEVKTINLKNEEIPADCALLIINNPREDFYYDKSQMNAVFSYSETDKIDIYLRTKQGALMVSRDHKLLNEDGTSKLKNLDNLLYEWGFDFSDTTVTDAVNNTGSSEKILGVYETSSNSYANAVYGEFASMPSAPHVVFPNTGYISCSFYETKTRLEDGAGEARITYEPFMTSYNTAIADDAKVGTMLDLAAVSVRREHDSDTNESTYSYVFCANSADFFSREVLFNSAYANFEIVSAVVNNISRNDVYASMDLGGSSVNSTKFAGKILVYDNLTEEPADIYGGNAQLVGTTRGFTGAIKVIIIVIACTVPCVPLVIGVIIKLRRKFL